MKLMEALSIVRDAKRRSGDSFACWLATGMNPLHLVTFLSAELGLLLPLHRIEIQQGLYGDFLGNLGRLAKSEADCGIILMEWSDLDPRLGLRAISPWSSASSADILSTVRARALEVRQTVEQTCGQMPVVLCLPTLPLPPLSFVPGWQASSFDIELRGIVQSVVARVSENAQVRVLNSQRIDLISPLNGRFDVESDLAMGFPYKLSHASLLAGLLANLVRKPVPKKGLITDLDDTLWRGIVGEVGADGISWDLDHQSQMHAFYQRLLGALSLEGVLLAAASKNEPSVVEKAIARSDLAVPASCIYPLEVSWGPKSEAVARILKTWNVGPDSVVFIDDSPLELEEVKASHPDVECLRFPTNDSAAIYDLAVRLRDLFGKSAVLEEDVIRAGSIRCSQIQESSVGATHTTSSEFLDRVEAKIGFDFSKSPLDPRALELVNKTNQFNLNGKRHTEGSWHKRLLSPTSFLLVVTYSDKFGPLGKIAVLAGHLDGKNLAIDTWVMSCRAFSRHIEYKCLEELFAKFGIHEIELDFVETERNGPLREFLSGVLGEKPSPGCTISRRWLETRAETPRETQEMTNG